MDEVEFSFRSMADLPDPTESQSFDGQESVDSQRLADAFQGLKDPSDLATLLQLRPDQLTHYAYGRGRRYRSFQVKKRRGGYRTILEPVGHLKKIQHRILQALMATFQPRPVVHGFVSRRSIATNAAVHVGRDWVLNVDLKDFFPTINFGRVRGLFIAAPYKLPPNVSTFLARLSTFRNELPQGSPSSPIISNMVAASMDFQLARLARRYRAKYTRFADDLTFSKSGVFPPALARWDPELFPERVADLGPKLREVIEKNGFQVNYDKVHLMFRDQRQIVTGLTVNELVNLPRSHLRRIRAMLHSWEVHGHELAEKEHFRRYDTKDRPHGQPKFRQIVKGHIDLLGHIRGTDHTWYRRCLDHYARLDSSYKLPPPKIRRPQHLWRWQDAIWVVETSMRQGTGFELDGIGLVTCAHVVLEEDGVEPQKIEVYHPRSPDRKFEAKLEAFDRHLDVAVLSVGTSCGRGLRLPASMKRLESGISVLAAGYPQHAPGASLWQDEGAISQVREFEGQTRYIVTFPIVAGASGSPVVDGHLCVIGMATRGVKDFTASAERVDGTRDHEDYGVIPISAIMAVVQRWFS